MAILVSFSKNSFPSTITLDTVFPFILMVPSSLTSAPGSFLTSSSRAEPSGNLYVSALYTKVSAFISTCATDVTTSASFSRLAFSFRAMVPMFTSFLPFSRVMFFHCVMYPTKVRRMMYLPAFTSVKRNLPWSSVEIPVTCVLSLGLSNTTEVPGRGPPSVASVTEPVRVIR